MKNAKKWLGIVGNVVLWLFVAFAVVITVLVFAANANDDGIPSIGGKSPISVLTDSMSPTFKAGDLILCDMLTDQQKSTLEVGDVITYYVDLNKDGIDEINNHRIVEKYEEGGYVYYITQGDNKVTNPIPDTDPVPYYDVICTWSGSRIPGLGAFLSFMQTQTGFLVVIVLPLVLFFFYELYRFIVTLIEVKGKKSGNISLEDEEAIKKKAIEEYLRQQNASQTPSPDAAPATPTAPPADEAKAPAAAPAVSGEAKADSSEDKPGDSE